MEKGQIIYYVQIFPTLKYGNILELKVINVDEKSITATDTVTKKSYYLGNNFETVFTTLTEAKACFDKAIEDGIIPEQKVKKRRKR